MIILAAGMPRAGSGWHYNLVHDIVVAAGGQDARQIRRRFLLTPILTEVNCNIGHLYFRRLAPVVVPAMLGNTFAIKTHSKPTAMARRLMNSKRMAVTYIYRDPRAALLSAYEYGENVRAAGRQNVFSRLETLQQAIDFIKRYLLIWRKWTEIEGVHVLRYEDLLRDYDGEANRLARFLKADPAHAAVKEAIEFYRSEKGLKGQHFEFGEAERFRTALTPDQLETANLAFEPYLTDMGYTP